MMRSGAKGYVTKDSPSAEMIEAIIAVSEGGTYICKEIHEKAEDRKIM